MELVSNPALLMLGFVAVMIVFIVTMNRVWPE